MEIQKLLNENEFQCCICFNVFSSNRVKNRHFKTVHTSPLKCIYCFKSLKISGRPDKLRQHLQHCKSYTWFK